MSDFDLNNVDKPWIKKDTNAVLDYSWDWTTWLDGDTIVGHQILPAATVTVQSSMVVDGVVTAFLSGGSGDDKLQVTCRITTAGGRTEDRSIYLKITDR
jgi:hypothetical protein